jgi:hypothetical protein
MKRLFLVSSILLLGLSLKGQYMQTKIQINPVEHDFGVFKEDGGKQSFDFIVTNKGNNPLIIQNVTASCGCTTPEWTRMPIPPGGKGKVTAIYDPVGRPGVFNKTLTVYSNAVPQASILTIKGEVTPRPKTVEELFTFQVGSVRFQSNQLAFSEVKKNSKKSQVMEIVNTSKAAVKVGFDVLPAHLTLKLIPEILQPGQKGKIEGIYDGTKNQNWGFASDMIKIKINEVVQGDILLYVSANLVEDFSALTPEELANAPVFKLALTTFDIGMMPQATSKEIEFKFINEGKSDLIIRNIKATCGCTAIQQGSQREGIKPGESGSIKATFNSGGYQGKVTKTINVHTNDPRKPEVVLMLTADVVKTPGK